ncbi:hypothetical protein [Sphingomonas jeddahensis]|uniref:Uncharacterized protein n=1 Tax=Sphingomonas jeddahensis TaxID=1915074 RepID=A0A1V2EVI8_9SPHN|nr:hypothetical protein [Sphingomonas jeddahensis]ONF96507.1 hypothetical protein SPHI_12920 [Sphingomonas jeddahensis]
MLQNITLQQGEAITLHQTNRHPELVSGSTLPAVVALRVAPWMLKQVQHDGVF